MLLTVQRYFLCFVFYSFVGWLYESIFYTIQQRKWVNTGFLNGCICPIYGLGAVLDWILLHNIQSPIRIFFYAMVLTCTLEYIISYVLEKLFNERWWDYTGWPFNLNGRICLIGGLAFGTMSVMLVKFIHPHTMNAVMRLSPAAVTLLCAVLFIIILADTSATLAGMGILLPFSKARSSFSKAVRRRIRYIQKVRLSYSKALRESFDKDEIVQRIKDVMEVIKK